MTRIFYFSGRGNSLASARRLAEMLGGASLERITSAAAGQSLALGEDDCLGLVFPVIDLGLPRSLRAFIRGLRPSDISPYVFAVATTGGLPAGILAQAAGLLHRRGIRLSASTLLPYSLREGDAEIRAGRLDSLAETVRRRETRLDGLGSWADRILMTGAGNGLARLLIPREDGKFRANEACDGCGICAKLCPAGDIEMRDGRPRWLGRCEQCSACFSWCPKRAISGTNLAARTHYTNPEVGLKDMFGCVCVSTKTTFY